MSLGENIRKARLTKSLTQKGLGDLLFVTAQAVSRWENNEVEPSIDMLKTIAEKLEVGLEELIVGQKEESKENSIPEVVPVVIDKPEVEVQESKPQQAQKRVVATCSHCHKEIFEGDQLFYPFRIRTRSGRTHHYHTDTTKPYCSSCERDRVKKQVDNEKALQKNVSRKRRIHGFVWGGLLGVITLIFFIYAAATNMFALTPIVTVFLGLLFAYALFSLVFTSIMKNNFIGDVFGNIIDWSIKMPGLIFSLDLDGIIWFLTVKLLFFILGVIGSILLFLLAVFVSSALAIFVFPFSVYWSYKRPDKTDLM